MKKIEPGTVVYKKVLVKDTVHDTVATAVLSMVVEENGGGFVADFEADIGGASNYKNKGRVKAAKVLSVMSVTPHCGLGTTCTVCVSSYNPETHRLVSAHDGRFEYKIDAVVSVPALDDSNVACSAGIHCFLTQQEAEDYRL